VTHDELIAAMHDLDRLDEERVEVWRIVLDEHGHELHRIFRGVFYRPRGSELQKEE
jgi:hypothetical protein